MPLINHDYPNANDFRVVNADGTPVIDATIRIYSQVAFEAGVLDAWVGSTTSDADGAWRDPIDIPDGGTWVVWIQKYTSYGPNHWELIT